MSENEGGESKGVGAFLLGFLTGVLVCLGIGFGLFVVAGRRSMMEAEMNAARAAKAEAEAHLERDRAVAAEQEMLRAREKAKLDAVRAAKDEKTLKELLDVKEAKEKEKQKQKQ